MALLELAMNQADLLNGLQQIHWQQVVDHMEQSASAPVVSASLQDSLGAEQLFDQHQAS